MKQISSTNLGIILVILSIALLFIVISYTSELMKAMNIGCEEVYGPDMGATCPHARSIPLQSYAGFTIVFILMGIGLYLILEGKGFIGKEVEQEKKLEKAMNTLQGDEKKIYKVIKESNGAVFQSELIEKTEFSKAKVTRTLDKLEGRGLVERRRRGMSNLVLIKR